jgi:hypothetical protein
MAEIVNISYLGSGIESQNYSQKDDSLITNSFIYTNFGDPNDNIEFFISDLNGIVLDKVYNANGYIPSPSINPSTGLFNSLTLDPQKDLASRGYTRGSLNIQYNFLRNLFNSSYGRFFWIKDISTSRTEIKLASQNISNSDILSGFNQYQAYIASLNYFNDFYLNFGNNQHIIAVNVAYTEDADGAYLLIKLYEPLPSDFDVKDQLWIVEKIAESSAYNIDIQVEAANITEQNVLRGPNYNININQQVGQTTPYYSYNGLFTTSVSSSFQKMLSYYQDKAININVDYSDFSNFIHFSSATSRVENFATKVGQIETYNRQISSSLAIAGGAAVSSSVLILQNLITDITTNFDTYEYYLYYVSSSFAWPKSTSTQPYSLYSITSSQAINWLGSTSIVPTATMHSVLFSASYYDATNKDLLVNTIPQYILDDANNQPYIDFVNMIAQYFDNIWLYYKDVTNRFDATNNPQTGISPDLVADALIGLGSTLYTNSNISDNLYYSIFGINQDGSLLPPTGSERISSYITSSLTTESSKTLQSEIYKRIYHNIPYLYKTKGTRESIKAITNIFGIPDSILKMNEFGGYSVSSIQGLDNINNYKVTGSTNTLEISSSVLSPDVTLQYYNNTSRLNSRNLEFGFSPSDEINNTISSSLGYFNIDQYIGNPAYQYSSSYAGLDQYERNFFSGYSYAHNIYEYIRLLKYFDNSIFKMVKDYVPARANLSEGLIIKSHILERNKYERHEPELDMDSNFSQSIDLVEVSGTDPDEIQFSTANSTYSQFTVNPTYYSSETTECYSYTGSWESTGASITASYIDSYTRATIDTILPDPPVTGLFKTPCARSGSFHFYDSGVIIPFFGLTVNDYGFVLNNAYAPVAINNTFGWEKYTGEFGGSEIQADFTTFDQVEYSSYTSPWTSSVSGFCSATYIFNGNSIGQHITASFTLCSGDVSSSIILGGADDSINVCTRTGTPITITPTYPYTVSTITGDCTPPSMFIGQDQGALYNNVTNAVLSNKMIGAEYSYGIGAPVNLSNIISQSSCESCNRIYCYNYQLNSTTNVSQSLMYQDCNNNQKYQTLNPSSSINICAKSETLQFYIYTGAPSHITFTTGSYTIITQRVCSTAFSNYAYDLYATAPPICINTNITFTSLIGSATVDYVGCYGAIGSRSISFPSSNTLGCIQSGSVNVIYDGFGSSGTYNITEGDVCITIPPYSQYCYNLGYGSVTGYTAWSIEYTTCDGTFKTKSGYNSGGGITNVSFTDCVRNLPIVTTGISLTLNTGSSNVCGYYEDQREYTGSRTLAEVQDYNYYRQSSINSKYNGAKSISAKYNVFTPGDDSYGTSPAIDYYIDYTGLFTSVESSSYFPNQMVAKMSYMADISGGLQDLNLQNNNWVYFQNMYKPGDIVTVKQFNATQYSNQKYLDQQWTVLESGWSYPPYWYRASGSTTECYDINVTSPGTDSIINTPNGTLTGSYGIYSWDNTYNLITTPYPDGFGFTSTRPDRSSSDPIVKCYPTITASAYLGDLGNVTSSIGTYYTSLYFDNNSYVTKYDPDNNFVSYLITESSHTNRNYITGSYYNTPVSGSYKIETSILYYYVKNLTDEDVSISLEVIKVSATSSLDVSLSNGVVIATQGYTREASDIHFSPEIGTGTPDSGATLISISKDVYLATGDKLFFRIKTTNLNQLMGTDPLGNLYQFGFFPYITSFYYEVNRSGIYGTQCITLSNPITNLISSSYSDPGEIPLTDTMSTYFNDPIYFLPYTSDNISSLYSSYGDVNYTTNIEIGDRIILYYSGSISSLPISNITPIEVQVIGVTIDGTSKTIQVYPDLPLYLNSNNINNYQKAVFVKRVPDETVAIIQGNKRPGDTSYGFLVPENVNPNIQKNINTLQATIQSQILNY